ncbi:MAG: hypothetical protein ABW123_24350 [Cystobacter sp.]
MLRLLLLLTLINGLVPAFGETLELLGDYAATGHVAHREPLAAEPGEEHGCGPTEHHCRCCASQSAMPATVTGLVLPDVRETPRTPFVHEGGAERPGVRLWRPPIRA